jgi:hypothetical protein
VLIKYILVAFLKGNCMYSELTIYYIAHLKLTVIFRRDTVSNGYVELFQTPVKIVPFLASTALHMLQSAHKYKLRREPSQLSGE